MSQATSTFQGPGLPTIGLSRGRFRVEVFDPRENPTALGARYVHGGYIAAVYRDDRLLTGAPKPEWDPYNGQGFPEVFEDSLGLHRAGEGEEFLRLGAGRVRKAGPEGPQARGPLSTPVRWALVERNPQHTVWECADELLIGGRPMGYQLRRTVRAEEWGLLSATRLKLTCPWSAPISWFPHPFFLQATGTGTAFKLPGGAVLGGNLATGDDGLLRLGEQGGFGPVTGLWGRREALEVRLDPALDPSRGGGTFRMEMSYPLDKLVVWGSRWVASVEPYFARAWHDGEQAEWTVSYRWIG